MAICSRIKQFHPATRVEGPPQPPSESPRRKRGRPKGSRSTPKPVPVRHAKVFGIHYADHSELPPALWNLVVSLTLTVFRGLLKVASQLKVEGSGEEQERLLFRELPQLLYRVVRDLAQWWWSYDRGFLGTRLRCPRCGSDLTYRGDVARSFVSLFGRLRVDRAYYVCSSRTCDGSLCPLDERLGLDKDGFLPSVCEVVSWLTSLDPYGKCLSFIGKLLRFTISHRSAWLITQRVGAISKSREDEAIENAFGNPTTPVFPEAEVAPPHTGVVMFDGTCGRVDQDDGEASSTQPANDDPDAPPKTANFREIKVGLAAHLRPPPRKRRPVTVPESKTVSTKSVRSKHQKVRNPGEEPTLAHKKLAVQLGPPQRLFQLILLLIYRLGLDKAKVILAIGDGAHWIWCGVREHLSSLGATVVEILDYWHAIEHLWQLANAFFGKGTKQAKAWVRAREAQLLKGNLVAFFNALDSLRERAQKAGNDLVELVDKEITYFRNNEGRIRYADYLAKGYLIGSGAMEGSCKHHIKERLDGPGMHWKPSGAMAVLRNRTLIKNSDWGDFWKAEAINRRLRYEQLKARLAA